MSTRHLDGAPWDRRVIIIPADEGVVFTLTEQPASVLSHPDAVDVAGDNMRYAEVTGIGLREESDRTGRIGRILDYRAAMAAADAEPAPQRGFRRRLAAGWAAFVATWTEGWL